MAFFKEIDAETGDVSQWGTVYGSRSVIATDEQVRAGDYAFKFMAEGADSEAGFADTYAFISSQRYVRFYIYLPTPVIFFGSTFNDEIDIPVYLSNTGHVFGFSIGTDGIPVGWAFGAEEGKMTFKLRSDTNFSLDEWHCVELFISDDGSEDPVNGMIAWVDGELLGEDMENVFTANNSILHYFGAYYWGWGIFNGSGSGTYDFYMDEIVFDPEPIGLIDDGGETEVTLDDLGFGMDLILINKSLMISDTNQSIDDNIILNRDFQLNETAQGSDLLLSNKSFLINDTAESFDETLNNKSINIMDSASALDTTLTNKQIVISDAGAGGDDLPIGKLLLINDQAELSDEILTTGSSHHFIADFGEGGDAVLVNKNILVSDAAEGSDIVVSDKSIFIIDTAEGTEQVLVGKAFFIIDNGQGNDAADIDAEMQRLIEDYGIGTDEIKVNKNFVINEAGTGTDLLLMIKDIHISDTVEGVDSVFMGKALLIIDFGQAAETISIIAGERFFSILRLDSAITMQQILLSSIITQHIIISQMQQELILNSRVKLK